MIRLGFAKVRYFTIKSRVLLKGIRLVKALINNVICVLVSVLVRSKLIFFA